MRIFMTGSERIWQRRDSEKYVSSSFWKKWETKTPLPVEGRICIRPTAPAGETISGFQVLADSWLMRAQRRGISRFTFFAAAREISRAILYRRSSAIPPLQSLTRAMIALISLFAILSSGQDRSSRKKKQRNITISEVKAFFLSMHPLIRTILYLQ